MDPKLTNSTGPAQAVSQSYGLHTNALGAVETLAQSVSATAPSTSSSLTIPLVYALAGQGTWLAYLMATCVCLLVGYCISRFARMSASPGSLYRYTAEALPPAFGVISGWALLLAYLATGASVAGGALYYVTLLSEQFLHWAPPAMVTLAAICACAGYIAFRDVKLSAEVMLWIELVSVALVVIVLGFVMARMGFHIDANQLQLKGVHFSSLGPALVLSIFSFVGFESATTLGAEARDPLRTIPRAVLQCAALGGMFFMLCSYSEVLGFRGLSTNLSETTSPMHLLADHAGVSVLALGIDVGAMVSMFACVLACATAAARVLLGMSVAGLIPRRFGQTNAKHGTPGAAIGLSVVLMFVATAVMASRGVAGFDMYDLAGSLSVFGFLTAYALVAAAAPFATHVPGENRVLVFAASAGAVVMTLLITVFDLRSSSDPVHARIPYIYLAYIAFGIAVYVVRKPRATVTKEGDAVMDLEA